MRGGTLAPNFGSHMKTFSATPADIDKKWILIDAEGIVLGRLATLVANILRGKNKPTFTPHMDMGDNVIIINADKVQMTCNKRNDKIYYWHTGHPGGIKQRTAKQILDGAHPERVVIKAVERMITRNRLGRVQMTNLRVYAGGEHPHEAHYLKLDISKARSRLGWHPVLRLNDALKLTIDWFKKRQAGANMRQLTLEQINEYQALTLN